MDPLKFWTIIVVVFSVGVAVGATGVILDRRVFSKIPMPRWKKKTAEVTENS